MNVYRVPWEHRLALALSLGFLTVLPVVMLALLSWKAEAEEIPWIPLLPVSLLGAWFFYIEVLRVPH